MLELRKGIDILAAVGGIASAAEARALLDRTIDADNLSKLSAVKNAEALVKLANAVATCRPERVFVVGPSEADAQACRDHALANGEEVPLAMAGHTVYTLSPSEIAAWRKAAEPTYKKWADQAAKTGVNADQALNELRASLAKYKAEFR